MSKIRKALKSIQNVCNDDDRKPLISIFLEVLKFGDLRVYFESLIYKADSGKLEHYVNDKTLNIVRRRFHLKYVQHSVLSNKNVFRNVMQDANLPIADYLAKIKDGFVHQNGLSIDVRSPIDLENVLIDIVKKNGSIFVKEINSFGGKDVYKFDNLMKINTGFYKPDKEYIIEKEVQQHPDLSRIYPHSINTLRVISQNINDNINIVGTFLRMGTGGNYVDNGSSNGIMLRYDLNKNELSSVAYSLFNTSTGSKSYRNHPDTNYTFKKQRLPYPHLVRELVIKAHKIIPDREIIGWDIAFTPEGPLIIEGNRSPHIIMNQIAFKGLLNNEAYKAFISTIDRSTE